MVMLPAKFILRASFQPMLSQVVWNSKLELSKVDAWTHFLGMNAEIGKSFEGDNCGAELEPDATFLDDLTIFYKILKCVKEWE